MAWVKSWIITCNTLILKAQMPLRNKYIWHTETYHFLKSFDCGTNPTLTMTLIFKIDVVSNIWLHRSYMCNNCFQRVPSEATQCIRQRIFIWEFNLGHLFNPLNSPQNPMILWPLKDKGTRYSSKNTLALENNSPAQPPWINYQQETLYQMTMGVLCYSYITISMDSTWRTVRI